MAVANGTIAEFSAWGVTTPVSIEFTPVNAAKGIVVAAVINGAVDDQFTGITVEGVAMSRVDFAIDSAGETGRAELWFLAGLFASGVAQTIQITTTGGAGTKWATVASVTSVSTPEIADSGKLEGDQANPQIALDTFPSSSLRMAVVFSGHDAAATLVAVTGMVTATGTAEHDFGTAVAKLGRQSTWSDQYTIGWTAASEDVAMVAIAIGEAAAGVLPYVVAGQSGHIDHSNLIHDALNGIDGYPASSDGPLAEFYNMMMAHFDGNRASPFFVNVQHPDFGANGRNNNTQNEAPALNEATSFASFGGISGPMRAVWLPATNSDGARARYYVDTPVKVYNGLTIWGYGARVAASPRFDFVTKFPTDPSTWTDMEQGIVEGYNPPANVDGRLALGNYNMRGLLIEGLFITGSIGAIFNIQQPSTWHQVRINEVNRIGLLLAGQQGIFHDLMITGPNPDFGASATHSMINLQLGMPDYVTDAPASFMWFYGSNFESAYRGVYQHRSNGANVFRDTHFEGVDSTNPADPAYCFYQERGQLVVDQAFWSLAPTTNHGTFFHVDGTVGQDATYDIKDVFISGGAPPNDNAVFLNDAIRGHLIRAWGNTKFTAGDQEGIVRQVYQFIGASNADGTFPRKHVITIAHDEGGYTAFGSYNRETVDADQQSLLRMRPGATQMGHLVSWYDKAGVERYVITADGMPRLPGYVVATKPSAVGREQIMIYDLDTNKVQVSDGSNWIDLH